MGGGVEGGGGGDSGGVGLGTRARQVPADHVHGGQVVGADRLDNARRGVGVERIVGDRARPVARIAAGDGVEGVEASRPPVGREIARRRLGEVAHARGRIVRQVHHRVAGLTIHAVADQQDTAHHLGHLVRGRAEEVVGPRVHRAGGVGVPIGEFRRAAEPDVAVEPGPVRGADAKRLGLGAGEPEEAADRGRRRQRSQEGGVHRAGRGVCRKRGDQLRIADADDVGLAFAQGVAGEASYRPLRRNLETSRTTVAVVVMLLSRNFAAAITSVMKPDGAELTLESQSS